MIGVRHLLMGIGLATLWIAAAAAEDLSVTTMRQVGAVVYPIAQSAPSPRAAAALEILKKEGLAGPGPAAAPSDVADRLGKAMLLGARTRQFLPEIAILYDALRRGSNADIRAAIGALQVKAGRKAPSDAELGRLVAAAQDAISDVGGVSQHVVIQRPDYKVLVDASPSAGVGQVTVVKQDAAGKPTERTTFSGTQVSKPAGDGKSIESNLVPDAPRTVTAEEADKARPSLNGDWTDQNGVKWVVEGEGGAIKLTQKRPSHAMAYDGQYTLGLVEATHLVNDVLDMDDGLPMDVRQALATVHHPPFTLKLEYNADKNELSGIWMSGQVTYDGISHEVSIVEVPTWDQRMVLSRKTGLKVAQGGKYPDDGP